MSDASNRPAARAETGKDRLQPWIAAIGSVLLHLAVLLVALLAPAPVVTPPQGASSGSWVQVDFIGETRERRSDVPKSGLRHSSIDIRHRGERRVHQNHARYDPRVEMIIDLRGVEPRDLDVGKQFI